MVTVSMVTKLHNNKMAAGQDVPYCLKWSAKDVAEWIGSLGYPQYKVGEAFKVLLSLEMAGVLYK